MHSYPPLPCSRRASVSVPSGTAVVKTPSRRVALTSTSVARKPASAPSDGAGVRSIVPFSQRPLDWAYVAFFIINLVVRGGVGKRRLSVHGDGGFDASPLIR